MARCRTSLPDLSCFRRRKMHAWGRFWRMKRARWVPGAGDGTLQDLPARPLLLPETQDARLGHALAHEACTLGPRSAGCGSPKFPKPAPRTQDVGFRPDSAAQYRMKRPRSGGCCRPERGRSGAPGAEGSAPGARGGAVRVGSMSGRRAEAPPERGRVVRPERGRGEAPEHEVEPQRQSAGPPEGLGWSSRWEWGRHRRWGRRGRCRGSAAAAGKCDQDAHSDVLRQESGPNAVGPMPGVQQLCPGPRGPGHNEQYRLRRTT